MIYFLQIKDLLFSRTNIYLTPEQRSTIYKNKDPICTRAKISFLLDQRSIIYKKKRSTIYTNKDLPCTRTKINYLQELPFHAKLEVELKILHQEPRILCNIWKLKIRSLPVFREGKKQSLQYLMPQPKLFISSDFLF